MAKGSKANPIDMTRDNTGNPLNKYKVVRLDFPPIKPSLWVSRQHNYVVPAVFTKLTMTGGKLKMVRFHKGGRVVRAASV